MEEKTKRLESEEDLYKALYWRHQIEMEQQKDDKQRQKEIDETNSWYEPARDQRQNALGYVNSLIDDFFMRQYEKNPHYRYRSRNGSVSKREITTFNHDDSKLLTHIPNKFIATNPKVKWGEYKTTLTATDDGRAVNEDGEIVDGVTTTKGIKVIIKSPEEER